MYMYMYHSYSRLAINRYGCQDFLWSAEQGISFHVPVAPENLISSLPQTSTKEGWPLFKVLIFPPKSWRKGKTVVLIIGITACKAKKEESPPRTEDFFDGHLVLKGVNSNRNNFN